MGGGGPFKVMGLYGSSGFSGGFSGGGSGNPRPITMSSIFKISESIPMVSTDTTTYSVLNERQDRGKDKMNERLPITWK